MIFLLSTLFCVLLNAAEYRPEDKTIASQRKLVHTACKTYSLDQESLVFQSISRSHKEIVLIGLMNDGHPQAPLQLRCLYIQKKIFKDAVTENFISFEQSTITFQDKLLDELFLKTAHKDLRCSYLPRESSEQVSCNHQWQIEKKGESCVIQLGTGTIETPRKQQMFTMELEILSQQRPKGLHIAFNLNVLEMSRKYIQSNSMTGAQILGLPTYPALPACFKELAPFKEKKQYWLRDVRKDGVNYYDGVISLEVFMLEDVLPDHQHAYISIAHISKRYGTQYYSIRQQKAEKYMGQIEVYKGDTLVSTYQHFMGPPCKWIVVSEPSGTSPSSFVLDVCSFKRLWGEQAAIFYHSLNISNVKGALNIATKKIVLPRPFI